MLISDRKTNRRIRPKYRANSAQISSILCHRYKAGREQYLVKWGVNANGFSPANAVYSWLPIEELYRALHLVQQYLETCQHAGSSSSTRPLSAAPSRKRKEPGDDSPISRDQSLGILTPAPSSHSGFTSTATTRSSAEDDDDDAEEFETFNGFLEKKEGWLVPKASTKSTTSKTTATILPTPQMIAESKITPVVEAERAIRNAFYHKIKRLPKLSLENHIDTSTPSLNFTFITDYAIGDGVYRAGVETYEGCQNPCKPNMGGHCGCELTKMCTCLEYAAVNEDKLAKDNPNVFAEYMRRRALGEIINTDGLPKRFPYHKAKDDGRLPQTLIPFYRESRNPIYECNQNCNCGPICKSRVVQKGRRVPLTIFKTRDRGWGVRCNEDLVQGEFIDTYLGEIITNEEADRREGSGTSDKASYLYSLDKFVGDDDELTPQNCYVVDGQYMGGPTRFINHSCEPNCRQYTVSYNKHDLRVYDLAFFAYEHIPAGTELTFDYMDKDEEEEEDALRSREEAAKDPNNLDKRPCNCGARKCRGYLWM